MHSSALENVYTDFPISRGGVQSRGSGGGGAPWSVVKAVIDSCQQNKSKWFGKQSGNLIKWLIRRRQATLLIYATFGKSLALHKVRIKRGPSLI